VPIQVTQHIRSATVIDDRTRRASDRFRRSKASGPNLGHALRLNYEAQLAGPVAVFHFIAVLSASNALLSVAAWELFVTQETAELNSLSSKASKRGHIDGIELGERILHLHTRCAVDDDARGLQYFHKSLAKVRAEPLQVGHDSGGVLEALIDVADLSIITDCPMVIEHTYLISPGRFNQLRI
jgi:hypothetical protein